VLNTVVASAGSLLSSFIAADKPLPENDLNPIALEMKELAWGFGAFVVFAVLLRYAIWPKLHSSIEGRNGRILADHAAAESTTAAARGDVAEYEAQRVAARTEAQKVVEQARATLEAERTARLAEVNAAIAQRRAEALAQVEASKAAARSEVTAAVTAVAATAGQLATGQRPSDELLRRAVDSTLNAGAAS
jgi:F-type H+-transporting ATPase subunit b